MSTTAATPNRNTAVAIATMTGIMSLRDFGAAALRNGGVLIWLGKDTLSIPLGDEGALVSSIPPPTNCGVVGDMIVAINSFCLATPIAGMVAVGTPLAAEYHSCARAPAVCGRASRRFSKACITTASRTGEMLGLNARIGGGFWLTCATATAVAVVEVNGTRPVSTSYKTMPRL